MGAHLAFTKPGLPHLGRATTTELSHVTKGISRAPLLLLHSDENRLLPFGGRLRRERHCWRHGEKFEKGSAPLLSRLFRESVSRRRSRWRITVKSVQPTVNFHSS
jgi:hypothetical protein